MNENLHMLAFDIETTGLKFHQDTITCACIYDPVISKERCFHFIMCSQEERKERIDDFLDELDKADRLCSFNGIQFDIPFIQVHFKVDADRVAMWLLKTVDLFHRYKTIHNITFSLDSALIKNNLKTKTSNGCEAIKMAREGRLDDLRDYCMMDTKLTYELTTLPYFNVPDKKVKK